MQNMKTQMIFFFLEIVSSRDDFQLLNFYFLFLVEIVSSRDDFQLLIIIYLFCGNSLFLFSFFFCENHLFKRRFPILKKYHSLLLGKNYRKFEIIFPTTVI